MDYLLQLLINGLVVGGMYVLIAVGLTLVFGILDVVNFAHGDLYMLGAYMTLLLAPLLGVPLWVVIILAVALCAGFGALIERVVFRPIRFTPHLNSIIASMGLSYLLSDGARILFSPDPQVLPSVLSGVMVLGNLFISYQRLLILAVALILVAALTLFVRRTWMGTAMRCVAQDLTAARLMGINVNRVAATTFAISAALAATAGALIGPLFVVEPTMGLRLGVKAFAVVILGGFGNVQGAVFSGFLLGIVEALTAGYISTGLKDLVAFIVLITVLVVRPSGIWGVKESA